MKDFATEKVGACALTRIFGYEPLVATRIVSALGSAAEFFDLSYSQKADLMGFDRKHLSKVGPHEMDEADRELKKLEKLGMRFLPCFSEDFPRQLLQCEDHPLGLYIRSDSPDSDIFNRGPAISIVGTRDISLYGKEWCTRIVKEIAAAPQKPSIISGLAIGVDICAHQSALECNLPTIAVLPTGIDEVYPLRHRASAEKIAHTPHCALVTDFPPGTTPQAVTFLRRNRIIAGLGDSTILIESKIKGGGLITARLAFDYGRDVFALPGRIDDVRSAGCNSLLLDKVADPIINPASITSQLGLGCFSRGKKQELEAEIRQLYRDNPDVGKLVEMALLIKKERGIDMEQLASKMSLDYGRASSLAGTLEADQVIDVDLLLRCSINYHRIG